MGALRSYWCAGGGFCRARPASAIQSQTQTRPGILDERSEAAMMNLEAIRPMAARSIPLAEGDAGTEQTVRAMRQLIDSGKKDPFVREVAVRIVQDAGIPAFDFEGEARALFQWARRNVRFTRDVQGKETLHSAPEIIRLGVGDCDDYTILLCALFGAIGHQCRIVTISSHAEDPEQFSHVYPEVMLGQDHWIPVDVGRRDPQFARSPSNYFRKRVWDASSEDFADVHGLAYQPRLLPLARSPNVYPIYRRLRNTPFLGVGRYGRPALRGLLGQDQQPQQGVDVGDVIGLITAGGAEAANIISAARAAPWNLYPTTSPTARVSSGVSTFPGYVTTPAGGIGTGTLLIAGLGILALLAFSRSRR